MVNKTSVIKLLPPELCNQIAAGEVVERPASVVKELVENSLDAKATQIDVRLDNGGQSLILVQDNGSGIPADQMDLAITRHATSKISSREDLDNILSYGFRGEALPSIASVSKFKITSLNKNSSSNVASCLEVEYGKTVSKKASCLPMGTSIEVRDLFGNLPGRLKFLKSPATELKRAQNWLCRLALAKPDVGFSFAAGDRQIINFAKNQDLRSRLRQIWPNELVDELSPFNCELHNIVISGLAAPPQLNQPRPDRIYFYVNHRAVNDKRLLSAVREAYKGKIISRDYPQLLLFVEIDPGEVDVNAHPAKTEVRFRNESAIFSAVLGALGHAFQSSSFSSNSSLSGFWGNMDSETIIPSKKETTTQSQWQDSFNFSKGTDVKSPYHNNYDIYESPEQNAPEKLEEAAHKIYPFTETIPAKGKLEYLGQIADTYLVCRDADSRLIIIDQHAAHEIILFSKLSSSAYKASSQILLDPMSVEIDKLDNESFDDIKLRLARLGFDIKMNGNTLKVFSIPEFFELVEARELLKECFAYGKDRQENIFASIACKAAIKAGQKLALDEAMELINQWHETGYREFCPHGRPVVLRWDSKTLEKLFKRR